MNIQQVLFEAQKILSQKKRTSTPLLDSEVLLAFILKKSFEYLYAHPEINVPQSRLLRFRRLIRKRAQGIPVAYLTGVKEFFGLKFYVNRHVLIPRPDTELLVECALQLANKKTHGHFVLPRPTPWTTSNQKDQNRALSILEIGAGSGCIAVTLKKYLPRARITATDISQKALDVARKNARQHYISVTFIHADLFAHPRLRSRKFDLVISNPPYLSRREASKQSLAYEPRVALIPSHMTPRAFFEILLREVSQHLTPQGVFLFEIGNHQQQMITRLVRLRIPSSNLTFFSDLSDQPRVACIQKLRNV